MKRLFSSLFFATFGGSLFAAPSPLVFNFLTGFPDKDTGSTAADVSGDGSVVCGNAESAAGVEAFLWRIESGMTALGDLPPDPVQSALEALSQDGSYAAGSVTRGTGGNRAALWEQGDGFSQLGTLAGSGIQFSSGLGISADGTKVVGNSSSTAGVRAILWTETAGMTNLGLISGTQSSVASAISADGSTVVGSSTSSNGDSMAFQWTEAGVLQALGDLSGGGAGSGAAAVSADGSVIVGHGSTSAGTEGVIFQGGSVTSVGDLPGGSTQCQLLDVTADGSMAVGFGQSANGREAVVWDATSGLRSLRQLMIEAGVEFGSFWAYQATAISDDGDVIVGNCVDATSRACGWVLSGAKSFLAGETPTEVRYPVPVTVRVRLENGLQLGNNPIVSILAEGSEAPTGTYANITNGAVSKRLYLLKGATYSITTELDHLQNLEETTLTAEEPVILQINLDGDKDSDGLLDSEEVVLGTRLDRADTDGDGLNDHDEVRLHSTNPKKVDSDGDRASDFAEVEAGTNPLNKADKPVNITVSVRLAKGITTTANEVTVHFNDETRTVVLNRGAGKLIIAVKSNTSHILSAEMGALTSGSPMTISLGTRNSAAAFTLDGDADEDGLLDSEEAKAKADPNNPDTDGDGISDGDEVKIYKTRAYLADSDGDGFTDAQEIALGTLPTNRKSVPLAFIEREVTMDLGFRYIDLNGVARDEHVDTNQFVRWVSTAARSPRTTGTLWMQYKLDGSFLRWLIRGQGGELDVTRYLATTGLKAPTTLNATVVESHTAGEAFHVDKSFSYRVTGKNTPTMTFVIAGRSDYQSITLPGTGLRLDLATATGDQPFLLQGTAMDPALTGKSLGILYGNVHLSTEVATIQGTDYTLP